LSQSLLGKLERLAKARFYIRELTGEDITKWTEAPEQYWMIAQSVNASSEIEGEHLQAGHLPLVLASPQTIGEEHLNQEEKRRLDATKSIVAACLWALQSDTRTTISFEFVMELHARMFDSTLPDIAGKLKEKQIAIRGAGYDVRTLPSEKAEVFLRALCERTSRMFKLAHDHAEASMFLCSAEFVCDFLAIHPFTDGNGRTARILSMYLLERSGYHFARFYPLEQVTLETRPQYYDSLFRAQRCWYGADEDLTPWIEYYTESVFAQWEQAHKRVRRQALSEQQR